MGALRAGQRLLDVRQQVQHKGDIAVQSRLIRFCSHLFGRYEQGGKLFFKGGIDFSRGDEFSEGLLHASTIGNPLVRGRANIPAPLLNGSVLRVGQIAYPPLQPIDHAIGAVLKNVALRRVDIGALPLQVVLFDISEKFIDLFVTGCDQYICNVRTDLRHQALPILLEGFQVEGQLFSCDRLIGGLEFFAHGSQEGGVFGKLGTAVPVQLTGKADFQRAALPRIQREIVIDIPGYHPVQMMVIPAWSAGADQQEGRHGNQEGSHFITIEMFSDFSMAAR